MLCIELLMAKAKAMDTNPALSDAASSDSKAVQEAFRIHANIVSSFSFVKHGVQIYGSQYEFFLIMLAFLLAASSDNLIVVAGGGREGYLSRLTAASVAAMTGLPRETVRRKLRKLCIAGNIEMLNNGRYLASFSSSDVSRILNQS